MCVGEYILVRMENIVNDSSLKGLVNELVEGRELTREIQLNLSEPHLSYDEAYGLIAKKILAKFENSLQILGYDSIDQLQIQFQQVKTETTDSPNSFSGSPKSQDSDGAFKGALEQKDESKKRKDRDNYYRVTQRLPSSPSSGLESPIEDGHNWRKYGQKDILGAKFPRAYYRCTFRLSQGCPATKHVQRSEDDPNFFDVTYRGKHTCSHASSSSSSSSEPNKQTLKLEPINFPSNPPHYPQNIMWDFKRSNYCNVKHDDKPINPNTIMGNYNDNNNNFVNHGNYPTYNTSSYTNTYQSCPLSNLINNNNYENHQQEVGLIQEIVQPLPSTSHPFLDHQGDDHFDGDFIIDDTNLFD